MGEAIEMKTKPATFGISLLAVLLLAGCAALQGLPQGSVLTGDYQGRFDGKFFWGTIEVRVYEAPGGGQAGDRQPPAGCPARGPGFPGGGEGLAHGGAVRFRVRIGHG